MSEFKDNVKVAIRVRPLNDRELVENPLKCLSVIENKTIYLDLKPEGKNFTYNSVAGEDMSQEELFEIVGKSITSFCMKGYNGTIFAYGQTRAGKTFTIQGEGYEEYSSTSNQTTTCEAFFQDVSSICSHQYPKKFQKDTRSTW